MKKPSITSIIVLGVIGAIFSTDSLLLATNHQTYSEQITNWVQASTGHLVMFVGGVVLLSVHWIFGNYKK